MVASTVGVQMPDVVLFLQRIPEANALSSELYFLTGIGYEGQLQCPIHSIAHMIAALQLMGSVVLETE